MVPAMVVVTLLSGILCHHRRWIDSSFANLLQNAASWPAIDPLAGKPTPKKSVDLKTLPTVSSLPLEWLSSLLVTSLSVAMLKSLLALALVTAVILSTALTKLALVGILLGIVDGTLS